MAKPNFKFQKRQKELDRKKKTDEKLQRKIAKKEPLPGDPPEESSEEEETDLDESAVEEEPKPE
jgi:AAA15 family ATPase/GTPase